MVVPTATVVPGLSCRLPVRFVLVRGIHVCTSGKENERDGVRACPKTMILGGPAQPIALVIFQGFADA